MGLRCLLGHDFGPPEIEREREETGDEMVVTVREIKTCRRCGEERVVSENKEVTAIRSPSEVDLDESETSDTAGDAGDATGRERAAGAGDSTEPEGRSAAPASAESTANAGGVDVAPEGTDDGVILDDEDDERAPGEWHDADESAATESTDRVDAAAEAVAGDDDSPDSAVADEDAELIDADDAPAADDAGGERPDAADPAAAEAESWPEHEGEDEGFDASQSTGGGPADVSFGGGLTPDAGGGSATDRERGEYVGTDGTSPDEDEASDDGFDDIVRVDSETAGNSDETEFFCPNCGLTESAEETSMRVGDICPSCHKGYVAERDA